MARLERSRNVGRPSLAGGPTETTARRARQTGLAPPKDIMV